MLNPHHAPHAGTDDVADNLVTRRGAISGFMFVLASLSAILWVIGYIYIMGLACAFSGPNATCRTKAPWELNGEDFQFLVLIPGTITFGLFLIAFLLRRGERAQNNDN